MMTFDWPNATVETGPGVIVTVTVTSGAPIPDGLNRTFSATFRATLTRSTGIASLDASASITGDVATLTLDRARGITGAQVRAAAESAATAVATKFDATGELDRLRSEIQAA